jgi:predicted nucleic acid-binding protein
VDETWVANASPIIVLAKAGLLDLLRDSAARVLVPGAVVDEVLRGPRDDPARLAIEAGWADRCEPAGVPGALTEWGLGEGETAVIAMAIEQPGARAVIDDAQARRCAASFGVPVIGTLGVLLRAERLRLLGSFSEAVSSLREAGLFIDDRLVQSLMGKRPTGGSG